MKIHFVGINGVSMRALARLAESRGHTVTGSDKATTGHDPENVEGCDLVVYTNAVPAGNCELMRARRLGIPTIERAAYLGEISKLYDKTVAVSGCHGKSTTAAMLGYALGSLYPTVHVGVDGESKTGGSHCFVTEACEYRRSFLKLAPTVGIILNIGYDHPDCYKTYDEMKDAYRAFASKCKKLLVYGDDPVSAQLGDITFGIKEDNVYRAADIKAENGKRSFTVLYMEKPLTKADLNVVGAHNVKNALAAIAAAHVLGCNALEAARALEKFTGLKRRFECKGIAYGKTVISDYAHHPDEIRATIECAKEIFPSVAVVFQPHTYSRTKALKSEFADALCLADSVILAPIFPAREKDDLGVSSQTIVDCSEQLRQKCKTVSSLDEAVVECKSLTEKAVIFMGAGDIDKAADLFIRPPEI